MTGISLQAAYIKYILTGNTSKDRRDREKDFFDLFINNQIHAKGFRKKSLTEELISIDLWKLIKTSHLIKKPNTEYELNLPTSSIYGNSEEGIKYIHVMVYEFPVVDAQPSTNGSGRKPNTSAWFRTVAEICHIIHSEGFSEMQTEFIEKIENAVRLQNAGEPLGRSNLEKMVSYIYRRCDR